MTKLEELRRARGWSKAELARRAQIGEADIGKMESGRLRPYAGQIQRLAAAFRVSVTKMHELLGGERSTPRPTSARRRTNR